MEISKTVTVDIEDYDYYNSAVIRLELLKQHAEANKYLNDDYVRLLVGAKEPEEEADNADA